MTALQLHNPRIRYSLFALWLLIVAGALYLYFFQREAVQAEMRNALSASFWVAVVAYLLIGSLRAFTLVPATFPLLVAMDRVLETLPGDEPPTLPCELPDSAEVCVCVCACVCCYTHV